MKKKCSKCKDPKDPSEFYKDSRNKDGLQSACIVCHKEVLADWRSRNKDKVKKYNKDKRQRKKEGIVKKHRFQKIATLYSEMAKESGVRNELTKEQLDTVAAHWHSRCVYCGEISETFDHLSPITGTGPNILYNVVPACEGCALKKNETDLFFWAFIAGKKIGPILTWAARDTELIKELNRIRERSCAHSFQSEMRIALKAAISNPQK